MVQNKCLLTDITKVKYWFTRPYLIYSRLFRKQDYTKKVKKLFCLCEYAHKLHFTQ